MLIYVCTKAQFLNDVSSGRIVSILEEVFRRKGLLHDNDRESTAWENSLSAVANVLNTKEFPDDLQIAVEYQIPQTSKRVDLVIAGEDTEGRPHLVLVELKQWTEALETTQPGIVKAFTGGQIRAVAHPSYQAFSYAKTLENFNTAIQEHQIGLHPCAYLHNYSPSKRERIFAPQYQEVLDAAPVFIKREETKFRKYLLQWVQRPPREEILKIVDQAEIRPSKALQDVLGNMLAGAEEFVLLDEQKVAYETVLSAIENALQDDQKRTIIIEGGPGTGKSVVAVRLLVELISRRGRNAQYVTKNAAPRNVYFKELRQEQYTLEYVKNLFKGSGSYVNCTKNAFDCLIADEAHRLNEKSGMYRNKGENQIKEIIAAAKVSVFFIDEDQIVTTSDIGSVDEITKWDRKCGSHLFRLEGGEDTLKLTSQFRCNGSEGYISFLNDLLEISSTANYDGFDGDYEIRVYEDVCQMREDLRQKNLINNKARMVAGYCYPWPSKNSNDPSIYDIELEGAFRARWNFNSTDTWAIDPDSFDQVGCIHTAQGLEFDYVGVIIGLDLRYENGHVITDPTKRAKSDQSLRGLKKRPNPELAGRIVRNTYKVLLTRGQKGCYIYCQDPALRDYLKKRIENISLPEA